jgi:hypothetical protein
MTVFPFFVGATRSGTTLARAMFDSHPEMAIPWESYFIMQLARRRGDYERDEFDVDRFLADLRRTPFPRWGLDEGEVRHGLLEARPAGFGDAVRALFAAYARSRGKARYGDKTPDYVYDLPTLASLLPETRFVHVIRDGRDVALSLLDVSWGPGTVEDAALLWKEAVSAGRAAGASLGPTRYKELRYERLVLDTTGTLRELCSFVELEFSPVMLRYFERADEIIAPDFFPEYHRRIALPPTPALRDWRREMSRGDQRCFEGVAGDLLAELSYPLSATAAGVS